MKLAIIGGTGFLGKCFLAEYGPTFSRIKLLTRTGTSLDNAETGILQLVKGTLSNRSAIETLLSGMDVLVHAGFDHNYAENIPGIKHLIRALSQKKNTIKRVIYLSSYVVYDRNEKVITEQSAPSGYCDIYTREKQLIEKLIRESASSVKFIILQPTIVLGSGGNWSKVLVEAAHSEVVKLSNAGTTTCNFVHVKDVAQAIEWAVRIPSQKIPDRITDILITGGMATWKEVLTVHGRIKANGGTPNGINARVEGTYDGRYGNSFFQNLIIGTLYIPVFRALMHPALKLMKRRKEQSKLAGQKYSSSAPYTFLGLSKAIQQVEHQVNGEKATLAMGYKASFTLSKIAMELSQIIPGVRSDATK